MANSPKRLRFPQSSRLKSTATIRRVVAEGPRILCAGFSAHWLRTDPKDTSEKPSATRIAFVASRQAGGATIRNRIKRRLREAARLNRAKWPTCTSIVLRARGSRIANMPFTALMDEMNRTFEEIGGKPLA